MQKTWRGNGAARGWVFDFGLGRLKWVKPTVMLVDVQACTGYGMCRLHRTWGKGKWLVGMTKGRERERRSLAVEMGEGDEGLRRVKTKMFVHDVHASGTSEVGLVLVQVRVVK